MCRNPGVLTYDWTKNGGQVSLTHIFFDCYLRNQKDCFLVALFRVVLDVFENQVKSSSKCSVIGDTNALTSVGPIERKRAGHTSNVGEANVRRTIVIILA